jgi:hypothetical protein
MEGSLSSRPHLILAVALLLAQPAKGQRATPNCTYDTCSLRVEGTRVVRGRNEVVGRVGSLSAVRLTPLVIASSDSGVAYARVFDRDYAPGARAVAGGAFLMGVGVGVSMLRGKSARVVGPSLVAVGAVVNLWGAPKLHRALEGLSRSIWWNNRGLAR